MLLFIYYLFYIALKLPQIVLPELQIAVLLTHCATSLYCVSLMRLKAVLFICTTTLFILLKTYSVTLCRLFKIFFVNIPRSFLSLIYYLLYIVKSDVQVYPRPPPYYISVAFNLCQSIATCISVVVKFVCRLFRITCTFCPQDTRDRVYQFLS